MNRIFLLIGIGWLCTIIPAEAQVTRKSERMVTLQEALQLSLANSAKLKKSKLDRTVVEQRVREEKALIYPQVTAGVSYDYYPILATQFLPGAALNRPGEAYVPVQFGQPWQLTAGINVQQMLYSESGRRALPLKNLTRQLYDILIERTAEEVAYQTASVFYQTLQTEQLLRAVNANIEKVDALQKMVELQLANGFAIPTDVKRVAVARTNLETQRHNLLAGIEGLRQTLQFLCGVPFEESFEPKTGLDKPAADSLRWQSLALDMNATTEYRLLTAQSEINRVQVKSAKGGAWPTLSAHASGFYQIQRPDANVLDPAGVWYGMAMVGAKLNMPLFDGFRRHRKVELLRLEEQKLAEDRRQFSGAKELEFRQARVQLQSALRQLRTQEENVALAREIADKLTLQYKEGINPLTDVLNAQTALSEAETGYWQQVFGYKISVLNLLKAAGQLEALQQEQ